MKPTFQKIVINPQDSPKAVKRITKSATCNTEWWYMLPGDQSPRPITRMGRMWKCRIPSVNGMEINADDDFHTIVEDLRLSGAKIYNTAR